MTILRVPGFIGTPAEDNVVRFDGSLWTLDNAAKTIFQGGVATGITSTDGSTDIVNDFISSSFFDTKGNTFRGSYILQSTGNTNTVQFTGRLAGTEIWDRPDRSCNNNMITAEITIIVDTIGATGSLVYLARTWDSVSDVSVNHSGILSSVDLTSGQYFRLRCLVDTAGDTLTLHGRSMILSRS